MRQRAKRTRTVLGSVVHVSERLNERARLLAAQLESDIHSALQQLGVQAEHAYRSERHPHEIPSSAVMGPMVNRILAALRLETFAQRRMRPIMRNHAARVMADTQRTLRAEIGIELRIGEQDSQRIMASAGEHLSMPDIAPQVRAAIMAAIQEGFAAGDNPLKTARRIRQYVPAGRFIHAGAAYRSKLIARTETLNLQRASTLAVYRSNPRVAHIQIRDGIFGEPRSDADCIARDGTIVPIAQAPQPLHPQCTLSYSPVISPVAPVLEPELPPEGVFEPVLALV